MKDYLNWMKLMKIKQNEKLCEMNKTLNLKIQTAESSDHSMDWELSNKSHYFNSDRSKNIYINNFLNNQTSNNRNPIPDHENHYSKQVFI